jgi:PKD repeat protein
MRAVWVFFLIILSFLVWPSCQWVNPTAPSGSSLFVSASPTTIAAGGAASLVTVIGYDAWGDPLKDRTIVYFTAGLGSIDLTAEMRNGRATATFKSGSQSGIAQVYVSSGLATVTPSPLEITVGISALAKLTIRANPASLPPGGGRAQILVDAFDKNGNGLADIPVLLSTDAGTLDSGGNTLTTNELGRVGDWLTTNKEANVKASSGSLSETVKISVAVNKAPKADFVYSPSSPKVNDMVNFNAANSSDEDGTIVRYDWDFGNGHTGTGVQTSCQYSAAATYKVTLVVQDNLGATASTRQDVAVKGNESPTAKFTFSPLSPKVGDTVYFNASASTDPDGFIVSYNWDFGDGQTASDVQATHQFAAAKSYSVTLVVKDNLGATGTTSQTVTVTATAGEALLSGQPQLPEDIARILPSKEEKGWETERIFIKK